MNNNDNGWILFRDYVNSIKNGDTFKRQDIFRVICIPSIDVYRRMLCLTNYISDFDRGRYKKIKNIPKCITITMLKDLAYGKDDKKITKIFKKIKMEERKLKIEDMKD